MAEGAAHTLPSLASAGKDASLDLRHTRPKPSPHSARDRREDQLLLQEDTIRAVYKKHAQNFFEEIKEGFLREATVLRKQVQRAVTHGQKQPAAIMDTEAQALSPGPGVSDLQLQVTTLQRQVANLEATSVASPKAIMDVPYPRGERKAPCEPKDITNPNSALSARLDRQQEELRNLTRHVQSEFSCARKATLTPMWKERALQEIAQGELRAVCADEVSKAFREYASSLSDSEVEAALLRICSSGPLPWEGRIRAELEDLRNGAAEQLAELSRRADESTAGRAVLLDRCASLEEARKDSLKEIEVLRAGLEKTGLRFGDKAEELERLVAKLGQQNEDVATSFSARCDKLNTECCSLDKSTQDLQDKLEAGLAMRCGALERRVEELSSRSDMDVLAARCDRLEQSLEQRCGKLESTVDDRCGKVESTLQGRYSNLEASLADRCARLQAGQDDRCARLEAAFEERCSRMDTAFESKLGRQEEGLDQRCSRLEGALADRSSKLDGVVQELKTTTEERCARLEGSVREVHGTADERCSRHETQLTERWGKQEAAIQDLRSAVEERCLELRGSFERRCTGLGAELRAALEDRAVVLQTAQEDGLSRLRVSVQAAEAQVGASRELVQRAQQAGETARRVAEEASLEARRAQELAAPARDAGARLAQLEPEVRQLRRGEEALSSEVRAVRAEAAAAGGSAARACAEAEGARSLASSLADTVASCEASAAHQAARVGGLEGQAEEARRQVDRIRALETRNEAVQRQAGQLAALEGRQEEIQRQSGKASEGIQLQLQKLAERVEELAEGATRQTARLGGAEARLEALRGAPERQASTIGRASGDERVAEAPDRAYVEARLAAHMDGVEARLQVLQRKTETLGDEQSTQAQRLADTSSRHAVRLEALEDSAREVRKQQGVLGEELGLHTRRLADASAQQALVQASWEERLGALQRRVDGLAADLAGSSRKAADTAAAHASRSAALEERSGQSARHEKLQTERLGALSSSLEELRCELATLSARISAGGLSIPIPEALVAGSASAATQPKAPPPRDLANTFRRRQPEETPKDKAQPEEVTELADLRNKVCLKLETWAMSSAPGEEAAADSIDSLKAHVRMQLAKLSEEGSLESAVSSAFQGMAGKGPVDGTRPVSRVSSRASSSLAPPAARVITSLLHHNVEAQTQDGGSSRSTPSPLPFSCADFTSDDDQ